MINPESSDPLSGEFNFDDFNFAEFEYPSMETLIALTDMVDVLKSSAKSAEHTHHRADGTAMTFKEYTLEKQNKKGVLLFSANEAPDDFLADTREGFEEVDAAYPLVSIYYSDIAEDGKMMSFDQYYGREPMLFVVDRSIDLIPEAVLDNEGTIRDLPLGGHAGSQYDTTDRKFWTEVAARREAIRLGTVNLTEGATKRFVAAVNDFLAEN